MVLNADGEVALANSRASEFLRVSPQLLQNNVLRARTVTACDLPSLTDPRAALGGASAADLASEIQLSDGRWLRVGQSVTQEGGVIIVCSDISALRQQRVQLHATNVLLDAALANMSQGLCLYDSEDRLQVVNTRFCEIFGIPREQVYPGIHLSDVLALSVAVGNGLGRVAAQFGQGQVNRTRDMATLVRHAREHIDHDN